jgi:hypothetical protein
VRNRSNTNLEIWHTGKNGSNRAILMMRPRKDAAVGMLAQTIGYNTEFDRTTFARDILNIVESGENPCSNPANCPPKESMCSDVEVEDLWDPPEDADFISCEQIEAEDGDLENVSEGTSGERTYITMRERPIARYVFYVPESESYNIYATVNAPNTDSNTTYYRVDRQTASIFSLGTSYGSWVQRPLRSDYYLYEGIHELEISNREIGARIDHLQIDPVYGCSGGGPVTEANLIGYWKFNGSDDEAVIDSGPYHYDGVMRNYAYRTDGITGDGIYLDGHYDYVLIEDSKNQVFNVTNGFTVMGWVKPDATPAPFSSDLISAGEDIPESDLQRDVTPQKRPAIAGIGGGYQLGIRKDDDLIRPAVMVYHPATRAADTFGYVACVGQTPLTADEWYHVAGTYDRSSRILALYVNGALACHRLVYDGDGLLSYPTPTHLYLGRWSESGSYLRGVIDEVKIYDAAMSAHQVVSEYITSRP